MTLFARCTIIAWQALVVPILLLYMVIAQGWNPYSMAIFCTYIFFAFFIFAWVATSIYLRIGWFIGMLVVLVYSHSWFIALFILVFFFLADLLLRRGLSREALSIRSFSSLHLYTMQGGNIQLLNHHWKYPQQRYALDLVGLGVSGRRAKGLFPSSREAYFCFGASIHSPLSGIVLKTEDGYPDLKVGESDLHHPYGNFIILQPSEHEEKQLVLAHLMNQSIMVKAGDTVQYGDIIGRIGNSGNTTEPHLHIHAQKIENGTVKGIPLRIEGHRFMKNSVIRKYQK
jgi:Peptidase family M23